MKGRRATVFFLGGGGCNKLITYYFFFVEGLFSTERIRETVSKRKGNHFNVCEGNSY